MTRRLVTLFLMCALNFLSGCGGASSSLFPPPDSGATGNSPEPHGTFNSLAIFSLRNPTGQYAFEIFANAYFWDVDTNSFSALSPPVTVTPPERWEFGQLSTTPDGNYIVGTFRLEDGNGMTSYTRVYRYNRAGNSFTDASTVNGGTPFIPESAGANASGAIHPSISDNGRYVVFESTATNLVTNDTNGERDVFLSDLNSHLITRVSTSSTGAQGTVGASGRLQSADPVITPDGRYIAFASTANNFASGDTNENWDVFVKDMQTQVIDRVSTSNLTDGQTSSTAVHPDISSNGRYVVFEAEPIYPHDFTFDGTTMSSPVSFDFHATNYSASFWRGYGSQIFLKDRVTRNVELVSIASDGRFAACGESRQARLSRDGRYVVFASSSQILVNGSLAANCNNHPIFHVFIHDRIAQTTTMISTNPASGLPIDGSCGDPRFSPDAHQVAFVCSPDHGSTGPTLDASYYLRDLNTGALRKIF